MLTFPFGSDIKFTLIQKVGDVPIPQSEMVDLIVKVENKNRGISFVPIWEWNDVGLEIEVQRNQIKAATIYTVVLDWRRPDSTYSDGYQDRMNYCTLIEFSRSCNIVSEDTAIIEVSPEYKGDKGDPFTYDDFTPDQIEELQRPATEAAASIEALETTISQNEQVRVTAESSRDSAEQTRASAESSRDSAEQTRVENEGVRVSNELGRVNAENDRVDAEEEREQKVSELWENITELAELPSFDITKKQMVVHEFGVLKWEDYE